jgi:hypothetical protein
MAAMASATVSVTRVPFVKIRNVNARCFTARAISSQSGCVSGSPPVIVTFREPRERRSSRTSSHSGSERR